MLAILIYFDTITGMAEPWTYETHGAEFGAFAKVSYSWEHVERPGLDEITEGLCQADTRALDIGCGSGRIMGYLAGRGITVSNITGLEPSLEMIKQARGNVAGGNFVNARAEQIPFSAESFDLVSCVHMLHYISGNDIANLLRDVHRILKPGGKMVIIEAALDDPETIGQWTSVKTPWGATLETFNHDFESLFGKTAPEIGFSSLTRQLSVIDPNPTDLVQYEKYTSGHFRIGALLEKA